MIVTQAVEFIDVLARGLPEAERMIVCGFAGDPALAQPGNWRPRPWKLGGDIPLGARWNGYVTVSSFLRAGDGSFRRRAETFAAGRALMVDDVGTKVDCALVSSVPPSARIETSPGNEQWWYLLDEPERDMSRFDGVIRAFIASKLLGADPGMSGVTRVGRLPGFYNMKPAYGGWQVQMRELTDRRFTLDELLQRFSLHINGRRVQRDKLQTAEALERNRAFAVTYTWLQERRMLKRDEPDRSGWTEMTCPWVGEHTGKADTGAALREPAAENDHYGAFRCHHGHCVDKGWAELTEWVAEESVEELNNAAKVAL